MGQIYLLVAGVMLCSIPACSLGWNLPRSHSQDNKEVFQPLEQMQRIPSQRSLKDRADFKFPWQRENITQIQMIQGCYHCLMLQQIFQLLNTEDSRAAWNNTLLDKPFPSLDQKLEQMEEDNLDCPDLGLAAREYFHGIHVYLKAKEYSPCAREVVRVEIEKCLSLM
ncbi:LOW QUALITY PROTEIN: interferon alpha-13-like [Physeter macrocephalus]|uniref:LOW QUALITY PROTEIN: interferon alpha-13-like n=1 Tax=Physeter macrocephalus TaxID=9755 RepID=A0A2Y9SWY6_PHYMC|nr:LOW QUALITY PROTEIN: interferon alpha-13-like [Physeter catodon]|eukprot:XP_023982693.1 LOW QUALITY PROTEIN: interferon alpha-13-like [Physeter catodon]